MQYHIYTSNTAKAAPEAKPEHRQETLRLQRVVVKDLQKAIVGNQLIPITHRSVLNSGVPFSALND